MAINDNDGVNWEGIGRQQLERAAARTADDLETAIRRLGVEIGRGTADSNDLAEARKAIEAAIYVVEDDLAPAVSGDTGRGDTRYVHNDGTAVEYLGITTAQANEARAGATVDLSTEEVRALSNGNGIEVNTPAGIDIELQPEEPDEVAHDLTLYEEDIQRLLNQKTVKHGLGGGHVVRLAIAENATTEIGP